MPNKKAEKIQSSPVANIPNCWEVVKWGYCIGIKIACQARSIHAHDLEKILYFSHHITMHRFLLRVVGRPHEAWHPQAIHMYLERLRPYAQVEVVEFEEHRDVNEKLFKNLPAGATVVVCDSRGAMLSSPDLARAVERWTEFGTTTVFIVGGSEGIDPTFVPSNAARLSFGKLTLPHILARIILLEQLYRAETILHGKTYHK